MISLFLYLESLSWLLTFSSNCSQSVEYSTYITKLGSIMMHLFRLPGRYTFTCDGVYMQSTVLNSWNILQNIQMLARWVRVDFIRKQLPLSWGVCALSRYPGSHWGCMCAVLSENLHVARRPPAGCPGITPSSSLLGSHL